MRAFTAKIAGIFYCINAYAAPIDCNQLKMSKIPYQITFESETLPVEGEPARDTNSLKTEDAVQIYRNDESYVIIYGVPRDIVLRSKAISRFGFGVSSEAKTIKNAINTQNNYNPLITEDKKSGRKDFNLRYNNIVTTDGENRTYYFEEKYYFKGAESFILGPCIFKVYKFDIIIITLSDDTQNALRYENPKKTILWSPELSTTLFTSSAWKVDGPEHRTNKTARKIVSDFIPVPQ